MTNLPPAADAPDDGYNEVWIGCEKDAPSEAFPDTLAGEIVSRTTLKFRQPRGEREAFEKLVVQRPDRELIDVPCGRARLARLVVKFDPQVGDLISVTAFGPDEKGWHRYGMNVDRSQREELDRLVGEAQESLPVEDAEAA